MHFFACLTAVCTTAAFCRSCLISSLLLRAWCSLSLEGVWLKHCCGFRPSGEKRAGCLLCFCERRSACSVRFMVLMQFNNSTISKKSSYPKRQKETSKTNGMSLQMPASTYVCIFFKHHLRQCMFIRVFVSVHCVKTPHKQKKDI